VVVSDFRTTKDGDTGWRTGEVRAFILSRAFRILRVVLTGIAIVALVSFIYANEARNHAHERLRGADGLQLTSELLAITGHR
jgi:hypothetical protein